MMIASVMAVRTTQALAGLTRDQSVRIWRLWLGPVIGLCSLAALGYLGFRAGGWALATCWMVAWPALQDIAGHTRFGNTDHHSLHQLLFICTVGGCLAWRSKPTSLGGMVVAIACVVAFWSGASEFLPMWGLVAWLALSELLSNDHERSCRAFWRSWWISRLIGTTSAWLFEFWPHPFHGYLEMLSVWHVGLWVVVGALIEYLVRGSGAKLEWRRAATYAALLLTGAVAAVILVAGIVRGFDWAHLHVAQGKWFHGLVELNREFSPFWSGSLEDEIAHTWWAYGLLPVLALALPGSNGWRELRQKWLMAVGVVYLVLMSRQLRWADFFVVTLVMISGLGICHRLSSRPWLGVLLIALATVPPWCLAAGVHRDVRSFGANPMLGPHRVTFALEAAAKCLRQTGPKPVVLAGWHVGPKLLGTGKVRIIGSANWSDLAGWTAMLELYSTTDESQFWSLMRERQVRYLFINSDLLDQIAQSYHLIHGKAPTMQRATESELWKLVSGGQFPQLPCDELSRIAPEWKILEVSSGSQNSHR